jgi:hypothetical protein
MVPEYIASPYDFYRSLSEWRKVDMAKEWLTAMDLLYLQSEMVVSGTTRIGFIGETHVFKIPWRPWNVRYNMVELEIFQRKPFPVAPCELVYRVGIPILKMERVYQQAGFNKYTDATLKAYPWIPEVGDGDQVGFLANGELVAYDYGHCGYTFHMKF